MLFCDCPNHKEHIKLYTHTAKSCHTCQHWLTSKLSDVTTTIPEDGMVGTVEDTTLSCLTNPTSSTPNDVSMLLASGLSLASSSSNICAQDLIANALTALHKS